MLFFMVVTNLVLSFQSLRLICFSLAGFNSFLSRYRFTFIVLLLQELIAFLQKIIYNVFVALMDVVVR